MYRNIIHCDSRCRLELKVVIVPIILLFNSVACMQSACAVSQVTLSSTLAMGKSGCPGERIDFTCIVNGSRILSWSSNEYIGNNGFQLEFSTFDENGLRLNSSTNPDTYAILESVIDANGISSLQSTLHIVSDQSSIVSCLSVNNSTKKSFNFNVLDELPGIPQDPAAVESSTGERNCVLLIEWDPPSNIASSNIKHYIINTYGKSDIPTTNATTTLATFLSTCEDLSNTNISIAAVDRCGRMGMNSANFTPNLLYPSPRVPNSSIDTRILVASLMSLMALVLITTILAIVISCYCVVTKVRNNSEEIKRLIEKDKMKPIVSGSNGSEAEGSEGLRRQDNTGSGTEEPTAAAAAKNLNIGDQGRHPPAQTGVELEVVVNQ